MLKLLKHGILAQDIFHDLYLETTSGKITQIDFVVLTKVGIVVFESKDYGGTIFGDANVNDWCQIMGNGQIQNSFYNPIKQNNGHLIQLQKKIRERVPFYSVIVFSDRCVLNNISNVPNGTCIIYEKQIQSTIEWLTKNLPTIQYKDKQSIVSILKASVDNGNKQSIKEKHMQNVSEAKNKNAL